MGSPNGLWTAVSGGMAQSQNLDVISNNLANVNTVGFKKDAAAFKEYLTSVERPENVNNDIPRTVFKDSDFYHHDGREHAFVNVNKVFTDHSQGALKPTHAPTDMAVEGPGYFAIKTPSGTQFTRAGDFKINNEGMLVTNDGYPVLALSAEAAEAVKAAAQGAEQAAVNQGAEQTKTAEPGKDRAPAAANPFTQPGALAPIVAKDQIASGEKLRIAPSGEIFAGADLIGVLALAEFADEKLLQKTASTLYTNPDAANVPRVSSQSLVRQGFLEASNVNPVSELVELLKANRMYESNMRAIKAYNDMSAKEANEVGKL